MNVKFSLRILILAFLIICNGYNFYDNQRFVVVRQEITVDRLPPAFDEFQILQISDLHGKYFGKDQVDLLRTINSLDYDMIAFTGDMNASNEMEDSISSSKGFLALLDGIENKEYMFWVDGNAGPYAIESVYGGMTGDFTDTGYVLYQNGCKILTLPYAIERGGSWIWVTPDMSEMIFEARYRSVLNGGIGVDNKEDYDKLREFYQEAYAIFQTIKGNSEAKIMLTHTPKQINLPAEEIKLYEDPLDYDLILAGHYHGGQIRLPFLGALYIPSPTTGIRNSGYFPSQRAVKGLSYYGSVPQYVSAGLGASGHTRLASFRLFNTPEINLITLRRQ